jgi:hypothetical protein
MCAEGSLTKATLARVKRCHQMIRIWTCFCDTFPLIDGNRLAGFLGQQELEETVLIYLLSEKIHLPRGISINRDDIQLLVETKILLPQEPRLPQRPTSLPPHHHRRAKHHSCLGSLDSCLRSHNSSLPSLTSRHRSYNFLDKDTQLLVVGSQLLPEKPQILAVEPQLLTESYNS